MKMKDLILAADPVTVDRLFCSQIVGSPKHQLQVTEQLHRFVERIRDIEPEDWGLIGLVVNGHMGPEVTVFSKNEIEEKFDPHSPLLAVEDVYKLPRDKARDLNMVHRFTRYLITDMPWEHALGIEVDPENIAVHGVEYAACDVICSMTFFGFGVEAHIQHMRKPMPLYGYSQAVLGDSSEYRIPLYTNVVEHKAIHHYLQRRKEL